MSIDLKYFKIAKELNKEFHSDLLDKKIHFRGNEHSFSLISVAKETAEIGVPNLKDKDEAIKYLEKSNELLKPKRNTPEKELQAWIIYYSMKNGGELPIKDNLKFITSELVIKNNEKYNLSKSDARDIRNDILAIDNKNNLCIIELKYKRVNEVKEQTKEFEKVVKNETEFFQQLVGLYTNQKWNGKIRKISVWPKKDGKTRSNMYPDVEEVNYVTDDENNGFKFE